MRSLFLTALVLFLSGLSLSARQSLNVNELKSVDETSGDILGGWEFVEVNYNFKKAPLFATIYYEHDNLEYNRLDCWFLRTTFGWKIAKFLKADVAYDFLQDPQHITHRAIFDITGSIKQGNLSVSLRERYIHSWTPETGSHSDLLRSRLKAQYKIPQTEIAPYLAVELFTWGSDWKRTRYYIASTYNFTDFMQLELYYIYYTFRNKPNEHVIGVGLNFDF